MDIRGDYESARSAYLAVDRVNSVISPRRLGSHHITEQGETNNNRKVAFAQTRETIYISVKSKKLIGSSLL